ncbi:MAG: Major Facilitator Superfamily protein [Methanosaeta sp. PtaU1.Bin028]|nr:MAG: Major Facilitator Superfamily protein [Methanosaeta sp. PtaU1.Bin028]
MVPDIIERHADQGGRLDGALAVAGCCLALFWPGAMNFGFPGVMAPVWQDMYHIGRGATGNTVFVLLATVGIFMFLVGRWQERYGTRALIAAGIVICSFGSILVAFASGMAMVYAWAFITGLASCFVYIPALTTVQRWYPNRKGLVAGVASMVFGISAALTAPLFDELLTTLGYQTMNIYVAVLIFITGLVGAYMARSPEGRNCGEAKASFESETSGRCISSLTVQEAARLSSFWFLWMIWALQGAAGIAMVTLSTGYGLARGFEMGSAVFILMAFNATNGMGRLISGLLSDILGRNLIMCLTFTGAGLAYILLPLASSLWLCALLAGVIGLAFGTLFSVSAPLVADCFGLGHFGSVFGLVFTGYGLVAGFLGPALSGHILDATGGDFSLVFLYLGAFCLLSGALIWRVQPPVRL